ncbi:hypothetical protein [Streptomyces lanatus]|uniref:Uncharacterized protein n=1 Tax=Streptomyces lanatus TaxID=66900 RepID=A0ABV1Y6R9_9ACTN|nr:hypothetical protein [Streptomyces lanatus]GHH12235.1 hypothetical protein GCM10018780_50730 [Streptomyces lanatus]
MDVAKDLALTDLLCTEPFPTERDRTEFPLGGPGYYIAELGPGSWPSTDDLYAYEAALVLLFDERWGKGSCWGSVTFMERRDRGEEIAEAWVVLGTRADDLHTWSATGTGRYVTLAVADRNPEAVPELLLMVTEFDPP